MSIASPTVQVRGLKILRNTQVVAAMIALDMVQAGEKLAAP